MLSVPTLLIKLALSSTGFEISVVESSLTAGYQDKE